MDDGTRPSISRPRSIPTSFPRTLAQPEFKEVSPEALQAVDPSLADIDINHLSLIRVSGSGKVSLLILERISES